jgi:signal peptidase I
MSARSRRFFGCFLPLAFALAACGVFFMLGYAGQVVVNVGPVKDASMAPVIRPEMTVLTNNTAFWFEDPYRPAIVTVRGPAGQEFRRLVGLPGETVRLADNQVLVNDQPVMKLSTATRFPDYGPVTLGPGQYFVLAESPEFGDSRTWGPVSRDDVFGVALFFRTAATGGAWQPIITPEPRGLRRRTPTP